MFVPPKLALMIACALSLTALAPPAPAAAPATTPAGAAAAAPAAIAANAYCTNCHATDRKVIGPSLHDIAAKYAGDPKAPAALAAKVRSGGKGVWGTVAMPPNGDKVIGDADLRTVIAWMLKQ